MSEILSDKQFAAHTLSNDGASRRISDHSVPSSGFMVGGAVDRNGARVPERAIPKPDFTPQAVQQHMDYLKSVGVHPSAHQGSWVRQSTGHVILDASDRMTSYAHARLRGIQRGEDSIWNVGSAKEHRTKPQRPVKN